MTKPDNKESTTGMNKWLLPILAGIVISLFGGGIAWIRSDIAELDRRNREDHQQYVKDQKVLTSLISDNHTIVFGLVKDVINNEKAIIKNTNDIEELKYE